MRPSHDLMPEKPLHHRIHVPVDQAACVLRGCNAQDNDQQEVSRFQVTLTVTLLFN